MGSVEAMETVLKTVISGRWRWCKVSSRRNCRVPYKGELNESMLQFIGGLRAGMGYVVVKISQRCKKQAVLFVSQLVESMRVILITLL
jgi:hypothetical protein